MKLIQIMLVSMISLSFPAVGQKKSDSNKNKPVVMASQAQPSKTSRDWKKILSAESYNIMVNKGTETPFKNPYWDNHAKGIYVSAATGDPLFSSDAKFESGTGWPSFYEPINSKAVSVVKDVSHGMLREEVVETSTGLHLGHVFDDGPKPTGLRYCMNSYALKFIPATKK